MTNKVLWLYAIIFTFVFLLLVSLFCLLSWNFPCFADAMERAYGGVVPKEEFGERIVVYTVILPFFFRGVCSFIELFPDDTKMVRPASKSVANEKEQGKEETE